MPFTIEPLTRPRALRRLALAGVCVTLMVAGVTPAAHAQVRDRGEHTQWLRRPRNLRLLLRGILLTVHSAS